MNNTFDANPVNSLVLKLQVIHSFAKWQSSYFVVNYGAIALKIAMAQNIKTRGSEMPPKGGLRMQQ